MPFSVGVLYSAQSFLQFIEKTPVKYRDFPKQFVTFEIAASENILAASVEGRWVRIDQDGHLYPTKRGLNIANASGPIEGLRIQLKYLIASCRPPWATLLVRGREVRPYLPENVQQCFFEAGLFDEPTDDIAKWWIDLADAARGIGEDIRHETGRQGEKLSIEFERARTRKSPIWQSIESSYAGYDLLSQMDSANDEPLMIEVKTTTNSLDDANFYLSRNEWEVATLTKNYILHLWILRPHPTLFIVKAAEVLAHIPKDIGAGKWRDVQIPFNALVKGISPTFSKAPPATLTGPLDGATFLTDKD